MSNNLDFLYFSHFIHKVIYESKKVVQTVSIVTKLAKKGERVFEKSRGWKRH
jgi:hypothetical protein